jgi:hypothetical protein
MAGEVTKRQIKVLPALIADCPLPPMLFDKLYADFRHGYYFGLRRLLEALCPDFYYDQKFFQKEEIEKAEQNLRELLPNEDVESLWLWFSKNGYALAALFGRLCTVLEAIPRVSLGTETVDFIIVNRQSGRYDLSIVVLGNPNWIRVYPDELMQEAERLERLLQWCKDHDDFVRRTLALRMASTYGGEQIAQYQCYVEIDAKLLCGRREEYGDAENRLRNEIYTNTNRRVDVISYDRVVDALSKIGRNW